jgi:MFS family permease
MQLLIFVTTFLIQFIIATEMNLISPLAPFLSEYFNIKDSSVILFNLGYSMVGIFVPYLGILADKYGKKRILSISMIIFIFGTLIASVAHNPILFAIARMFIGLGYFSSSGANISYVSEFISYENRGKASGILRTAFGIAILTSPIFATTLTNRFNNTASIYLPLGILALISLLLLQKLPETKKSLDVKFESKEFIQLLKDSRSKKVFISLFLILTAPILLLNYFGIYLSNEFNLSQINIGLAYTFVAIGTISGILVSTLITDKIGKLRTTKIFFSILVLSQLPIPYVKNLSLLIFLTTIFAFGLDGGFTAFQTFASEIQPEKRGTFMSLFYTVNALTITLYSIVGSIIYGIGGFSLCITLGIICSVLAFLILLKLDN